MDAAVPRMLLGSDLMQSLVKLIPEGFHLEGEMPGQRKGTRYAPYYTYGDHNGDTCLECCKASWVVDAHAR